MSVKSDNSVRSADISVRPVQTPSCWTPAHSTPGPRTTDGTQIPKSAGSHGGGTSRNGSGFAPVRCRSDHPVLSGPDRCLHRSWPGRMQREASHIPTGSTRTANCRHSLRHHLHHQQQIGHIDLTVRRARRINIEMLVMHRVGHKQSQDDPFHDQDIAGIHTS
jgi:hypothetical protein